MKNFLLEHTDYLTDCMITYIKKTKLVFYKEYKHFRLYGYSTKKNKNYSLCGKRIERLYTDLLKDFGIQVKYLNIVMIDCPNTRKFIDHPHYINGGFTYLHKDIIFVYRNDEMFKVVLHEVIHHAFYFKDYDMYLGDPIRSKVNINFNEAIVEFLATLYQIKYTNSSIKDELKHSLKNVKYVLGMPNITFDTNIYSYIVIKHLLLKKHKLIFNLIQQKQYDKIYQYIYNTKINIKPIKPIKQKLIFVSVSYL